VRRWLGMGVWAVAVCGSAWADQVVLHDVPSYIWYHGCGPTAGGMVLGYWDARGFPDLIAGRRNTWSDDPCDWPGGEEVNDPVRAMVASAGHIRDYVPDPDRTATPDDPYHPFDCLADFMGCSIGRRKYGESLENKQYVGLRNYTGYCGYPQPASGYLLFGPLWDKLVAEIDAGRPMEFYVDRAGTGTAAHFVTVIGYDDAPNALRYAFYSTYDHVVHWADFARKAVGQPYGVASGTWFDPGEAPRPGDADKDGDVDWDDYAAAKGRFGLASEARWADGDFDDDGDTDYLDYLAIKKAYSAVLPSQDTRSLPEPATGLLLLAGVLLAWPRRRRAQVALYARS
jgi:hypothetical protein